MEALSTLSLSLIFGFGPPLFWLFFWLQEDKDHPEPRRAILSTFFIGGLVVILAIMAEKFSEPFIQNSFYLFLCWAIIEEGAKLIAVLFSKNYLGAPIDEPIDWLIYMITAALGFAAIENTLFLLEPFSSSQILEGMLVSNLRFMGATVLHLIASATHGVALGLCFYLSTKLKRRYYLLGFSMAVIVHLLFNYFLVSGGQTIGSVIVVFGIIWFLLLPLILFFEKLKQVNKPRSLL